MLLSILIVNYNTETYISELLEDILKQTLAIQNYEVILVNNVQNEKLAQVINNIFADTPLHIKIIQSPTNIGFGRAMNLAAQHAQGQHLLIGNPDLRMLQDDYLDQILQQAAIHDNYGVITTRQINDDGLDTSTHKYFEFQNDLGYQNQINWFVGALLLIKKSTFEQLSGFNPDFFMYCEDEDLCLRAKKLNLPLIKLDELSIYHKGGSSEPSQDYAFYHRWFKSKLLFAAKHFPSSEFSALIHQQFKKSNNKLKLYQLLSLTGISKYKARKAKWHAMRDCTHKTLQESTDWLSFK